jgi:signal transduction histidine kinase
MFLLGTLTTFIDVSAQPADTQLTSPTNPLIPEDEFFTIDLTRIVINSDTLDFSPDSLPDPLLVSSSDTLLFFFELEQVQGAQLKGDINFLYKVELDNGNNGSSVRSINQPFVSYINLPEEEYVFAVSAFDIRKEWITSPATLNVRVDDGEVALRDSLLSMREAMLGLVQEERGMFEVDKTSAIPFATGIIFTVLVTGLLYILVTNKNRTKKKKGSDLKDHDIYKSAPYQALLAEKDRLERELAALRGQISGMEGRSQEIQKQNRELEEKVSKLTEYKDNLEELQEQKDDLFAVIIHDIKNPVGIIKNLVELLRSFDLTATEQQEIMEDIVKTTQTIVSLSHEVSRVLALEGGRMSMNFTKQELDPLAKEIVSRNVAKAAKKNIMLEVMTGNVGEFSYDAMKIYEVLDNLVSNAIKFTQEGGAVRIKTYEKDSNAVIEVADNGLGLSEDDLQKAFKKGSQLSARPTAGESSTGLGLWIVKKLVEAHEGRVSVKSTLGQGSTFSVFLPMNSTPQTKTVEM